ncbi:c-type cytochrome [Roseomonas elaeocarpi]|uniref:C-type cytochrome n=1 Tax=Roseomonas elaeocarpi TaxID=907779 RepID=A0ABV6JPJ5_9PROT
MRARYFLLAGLAAVVLGVGGFAAYAWHPAIAPVTPPAPGSFDADVVRRGAELAAIGNCNVCHTAAGGKVFAGGFPMPTPFGTVYSTNITPDPDTGIGRWSEAAFTRAMREGLDRDGQHLYPAFPYDHFTRTTDADNHALYAFLMTREPVRATAPANDLPFPLNQRWVLAGWKLLFFREGGRAIPAPADGAQALAARGGAPAASPDAARGATPVAAPGATPGGTSDALWQRGAYLAEGLGHCGACHTPRNALGAEREDAHFAGGEAEGWHAYALNAASPAAVPWTEAAMADYLRHGWQAQHGVARGAMAPVVGNLASVPEEDVRAIAHYVVSRMGVPAAERQRQAQAALERARGGGPGARPVAGDSQVASGSPAGGSAAGAGATAAGTRSGGTVPAGAAPGVTATGTDAANGTPAPAATVGATATGTAANGNEAGRAIYAATCATCHEAGRPLPFGGMNLALSTGVTGPSPENLLNVVLNGLPASAGERAPIMPGFRGTLDDAQLAALARYLRADFAPGRPGWDKVEDQVRAARDRDRASSRPMVASRDAPAEPARP